MADERLRIPVDDAYVAALGHVAYTFARLEWSVVWCCDRLQPGYIKTMREKTNKKTGKKTGKTAGVIADEFIRLIDEIPDAKKRSLHSGPGDEFQRLVAVRNGILHGKPGTAPSGEQRLFRAGKAWTVDALLRASDEFAACELSLNPLLHLPQVKP